MLEKYLTVSVNAHSLLPFTDEFVRQGLISQISIMLLVVSLNVTFVSLCFFKSNFDRECYTKYP